MMVSPPGDRDARRANRKVAKEPQEQSAAAPSPSPPIADYAFLSNCHTGALVAPDGAIDWLCVPRFDSPSVFGSLLDREAGSSRFGPFGINHPTTRIYEPGTNVPSRADRGCGAHDRPRSPMTCVDCAYTALSSASRKLTAT